MMCSRSSGMSFLTGQVAHQVGRSCWYSDLRVPGRAVGRVALVLDADACMFT